MRRPLVVGLPGVVTALKQHIRRAVIRHDENHVALPIRLVLVLRDRRQAAEIHAAEPVCGNLQRRGRLPAALVQILRARLRRLLRKALKLAAILHQPRPLAAIVACAEDLQFESTRRSRGHQNPDLLTRLHTLPRAVTLNRRAPHAIPRVQLHPRQLPVITPRPRILLRDRIRREERGKEQETSESRFHGS